MDMKVPTQLLGLLLLWLPGEEGEPWEFTQPVHSALPAKASYNMIHSVGICFYASNLRSQFRNPDDPVPILAVCISGRQSHHHLSGQSEC